MNSLHPFQSGIVEECMKKGSGGLALPMGSGKTLVSLCVALRQCSADEKILIVASKSLIQSWKHELEKFFSDVPIAIALLTETLCVKDAKVVLTTPSTLVKFYKSQELFDSVVQRPAEFGGANTYIRVKAPLGTGIFFGCRWGVLIVDEVHKYTNFTTITCRSILALCVRNRWLLSGTIMPEATPSRIFGFHLLLNEKSMPRNYPQAKRYISKRYTGLVHLLVIRYSNDMFVNRPKITTRVVKHALTENERAIYTIFQELSVDLTASLNDAVENGNRNDAALIRIEMSLIICHLRIFIVAPMVALSRIFLAVSDGTHSQDSSVHKIYNMLKGIGMASFMDDVKSLKTSRISSILDTVNTTSNRTVVFSAFRLNLKYLEMFLEHRQVIVIYSSDSSDERGAKVKLFNESEKAILLLTYAIGSDGLNLQGGETVLLLDVWWNKSTSEQAVARVYRFGQSSDVTVYTFFSNTGIERGMLHKHADKSFVSEEILTGPPKSSVRTMKVEDVIKLF